MVVVVRPADAEAVLTGFLHLRRTVAALPVFPLGGEEQVASAVNADLLNCPIYNPISVFESLLSFDQRRRRVRKPRRGED